MTQENGSDRASEKILYMLTKAGENPELAILPFMHAVGALTMDVEAVVVLMANSVRLAERGYAASVSAHGSPALKEVMDQFFELGGKMLLCTPCLKGRKIAEEDLVEGAELIAAARFTQEVLDADAVLSY